MSIDGASRDGRGNFLAGVRTPGLARGTRCRALRGAVRRALEPLEPRVLLSGALWYVNDNWHSGTPGLAVGDTVDNSGTGDDGSLQGLTFGVNAFDTLAGALAVASSGDRIVLVSGSYAENATITQGVSLEGWGYFAANPDLQFLNQTMLNATLVTQISGAQWNVNDPTAVDSVAVRGMAFSTIALTGTIQSSTANLARLLVLGNSFTDSGTAGTAVRINAGSTMRPVDIENNVFTGVSRAVDANGVTGVIAGNSASGATMAITVCGGENLTIANNTIVAQGPETPSIGILTDATGAGVTVTGNDVTMDFTLGIVVSNTGTNSVAVTANVLVQATTWGEGAIVVTDLVSGFGFADGRAQAVVSGNWITSGNQTGAVQITGILLYGVSDPVAATIANNQVDHVFVGIDIQGMAHATIQQNVVTQATTGIEVAGGGGALIAGNVVDNTGTGIVYNSSAAGTITGTRFDLGTPNGTDIRITVGGQLVFAGGDHFSASIRFVDNRSATNFALAGEDFGTTDAATINERIWDYLDNPALGLVSWVLPGTVVGEQVFYKASSAFDASGHDAAIATNKVALLPGETATFSNYTSYHRGLNGIMVDLSGTVSGLTAADFVFKTGNDNSPDGWTPVTAVPAITVRPGPGSGGTRVEITFDDGAIKNAWLQVTVLAGAHTNLLDPAVFYFGNAIGEAGNSATDARVNVMDVLMTRAVAPAPVDITNPLDYNRDGTVNGADAAIALQNISWFGNELHLITVPVIAPAFAPAARRQFITRDTPAASSTMLTPAAGMIATIGTTAPADPKAADQTLPAATVLATDMVVTSDTGGSNPVDAVDAELVPVTQAAAPDSSEPVIFVELQRPSTAPGISTEPVDLLALDPLALP